MSIKSIFDQYINQAYPHRYRTTLHLTAIAGGTPSDPRVAEGWLRSKVAASDDLIRAAVAEVMAERGVSVEEATAEVDLRKHLNGFKRYRCDQCTPGMPLCADGKHELYIDGRQVKALIKEASNVRWPWPMYNWTILGLRQSKTGTPTAGAADGRAEVKGEGKGKATLSYVAEHIFVEEHTIGLGVYEPTEVQQRFVHTWRGSGIQYEEIVDPAVIQFTVATDHDLTKEQWALLWSTAQHIGLGASRSQGFGRFKVTGWDKL